MPAFLIRNRHLLIALHLAFAGSAAFAQNGSIAYAPASSRQAVGEVTFAVGPTVRMSADGVPETVTRGTKIMQGDRLDTAEGGLLHIRFIDGALLSLRPGSRLHVEEYRYNPANVAQSTVRFKLDHGVARAISGAAAEGAKERFRLNTPLVAIGVRGTDFVVRSDADATTALVNQGAIVVAPFGTGCVAQSLGPCTSPAAKTLSADMGQMLVEFRPQFTAPEIKPLESSNTTLASAKTEPKPEQPKVVVANTPARSTEAGEEATLSANVKRELATLPKFAPPVVETVAVVTTPAPAPAPVVVAPPAPTPPPVAPPAPDVVAPPAPVAPPPAPVVPVVVTPPAPVVPPPPPQLAWGRWGDAVPKDISLSMAEARDGRTATVGNDHYILYRNENGTATPPLAALDFSLQASQAQFARSGTTVPANVLGGFLMIDFARGAFNTAIDVTSVPTGVVNVTASGQVRGDGLFLHRGANVVVGTTSKDAKSAGYFFEKNVNNGTLSGITLWTRP